MILGEKKLAKRNLVSLVNCPCNQEVSGKANEPPPPHMRKESFEKSSPMFLTDGGLLVGQDAVSPM